MNTSLVDILNTRTVEESEINLITHSPYYDMEQFINKNKTHKNRFIALSLNIQSLNAKFDSLTIMIEQMQSKGCIVGAICIQETWGSENTNYDLYKLHNYNIIPQGKICSAHGGLCIYLHEKFTYSNIDIYTRSNIWEGQFIKIKNIKGRILTIGNIYRPPEDVNLNYETFTREFNQILTRLQNKNTDILIAGDYNIDLLKIQEKQAITNYYETIISSGFFPKITLPTRLSQRSGTLIDNILSNITKHTINSTGGIIHTSISDHFPIFVTMDETPPMVEKPKYVTLENKSDEDMNNFKNASLFTNLYGKLNKDLTTDPNKNYDILEQTIIEAKNKYLPVKTIRYNKYKHKKCEWITTGILISIKHKDKLYKKMKHATANTDAYNSVQINFKAYDKLLKLTNELIRKCIIIKVYKITKAI